MSSVDTKRRIRVTLKFPEIPPAFGRLDKDGTTHLKWDIKAPARDFEGDIRWYISKQGHLSIIEADAGHTDELITFAFGQWMAVEYL